MSRKNSGLRRTKRQKQRPSVFQKQRPPVFIHPARTVERHNGLIRRFIPKGKRIDSYTSEQISQIELWSNSLPRKLLGYRTPDEIFEAEVDKIYNTAA